MCSCNLIMIQLPYTLGSLFGAISSPAYVNRDSSVPPQAWYHDIAQSTVVNVHLAFTVTLIAARAELSSVLLRDGSYMLRLRESDRMAGQTRET